MDWDAQVLSITRENKYQILNNNKHQKSTIVAKTIIITK
jgi:hypothetical protein